MDKQPVDALKKYYFTKPEKVNDIFATLMVKLVESHEKPVPTLEEVQAYANSLTADQAACLGAIVALSVSAALKKRGF